RRTPDPNLDHLRFPQHPRSQALNLRRERRGKKEGLPVGRDLFDDSAHIREKSHVEHPIDFIEDEDVDVAKIERALLHEVEQSARGGDHNVHAPSGFLSLFAITDAAVHYRNTKIGEPAIIAKSGFDLGRKLTRRL